MGANMTNAGGRTWLAAALLAAAGLAGGLGAQAQEHPEHPQEHPGSKPRAAVSREALGQAIRDYVTKDSKLKGGYFLVWDGVAKKTLVLTLEKVHDDKLAQVSPGVYFACADFKALDGATYDLDIFMAGESATELTTTEIAVHKENGKERYTWAQEGGLWKKQEKR